MTTKTKDKCVGLIGLGYWGKNILRNLYEMGALRRACDSSAEVVEARRAQFPEADYCCSFADLLGSDDVRAVAVATPAATHYDVVKAALLAGKDVFVEKPLALTVRQGEELAGLAEERKRVLMVGHILQYHPAVRKLKEMVGRGDLGKIQYVYSNRLNIGMLRTEENILWSFAPHDISVILGLLGDEPVSVDAFGGCYLNEGIFDTTMTALEFRNGVRAHIFVSWLHPYKEQKLILVGSKAMAVFDDVSKEKLFVYPHSIEWKEGRIPVAQKAAYEVVAIDGGEPLRLQMEHFLECVETRQRPRTDGREGLRVLRILDMAETALRRKRPAPAAAHASEPGGPQVHETACVDDGVVLGPGVKVWHFSHILRGSRVGRGSIIGQNVVIGPDVTVGDRCKVQNNVSLYKGVTLEDEVFCGPSCVFTNVYNPRAFIERKHEFLPTLVKRGATIGANATIVCGVTIGRYAMVGAGAVVKGDVADYAVVAGVPARQIGWACRCGTTLAFGNGDALCTYCGNRYALREGTFQAVTERD